MDGARLIHMANQIASFFGADPDREAAIEGVANHLRRFWDPRMRQQIVALVEGRQHEGMQPLVEEAIRRHHDRLLGR